MQFKEWFLFVESKEEKALALELAGDALQELNSVIPQNQKDTDPLLLLAAYFYNKEKDLKRIQKDIQDYLNLVKNQKMTLIKVNLQNKSPDKPFDSYHYWSNTIHGKKDEEKFKQDKKFKPSEIDFQNEKPILTSPDGKIKIYESNSPKQCIILGRGQSFCISQPGNTMWKSYRDNTVSTFYFVYDDTRDDELSIVVVDKQEHGTELTDRRNTTGTTKDPFTGEDTTNPDSYLEYLQKKGIDTSKIINKAKTEEEVAEDNKIGKQNEDLNWFISLSPTEKSNYIGRGHHLSNEQFDYIFNNKFISLLEQYVKTGLQLNDYQIDKIVLNSDLRKNYIHNRTIAMRHNFNINQKEFELMNDEQKKKIKEIPEETVFYKAGDGDDFESIRYWVDLQNKSTLENMEGLVNFVTSNWVAPKEKVINFLKYIIAKGAQVNSGAISGAALYKNLELVKYLVDDVKAPIDNYSIIHAIEEIKGYSPAKGLEILKYLFEKGSHLFEKDTEIKPYMIEKTKDPQTKQYLLSKM